MKNVVIGEYLIDWEEGAKFKSLIGIIIQIIHQKRVNKGL